MSNILVNDIECPWCHKTVINKLFFNWGAMDLVYYLNDRVKWYARPDKTLIPSYTYYKGGILNLGNPSFDKLIAFDILDYTPGNQSPCPNCDKRIGAIGAVIKNNQITDTIIMNTEIIWDLFKENHCDCTTLRITEEGYIPYYMPDYSKIPDKQEPFAKPMILEDS